MTKTDLTLGDRLQARGVSRRAFLKYCATTASLLALPPTMVPHIANALESQRRPSVIWLSFQECTGCSESILRSNTPSIESMIFETISLDYHHTIMAASGHQAEEARKIAMEENWGNYLVIVDGSVPTGNMGYSTTAGESNIDTLKHVAEGAAAIVCMGTCSAFGGIPYANPNPTDAVAVSDVIKDKPIVNVPGCPPIPAVMTSVLAHYLAFGELPELDHLNRPKVFYGQNIHDRCYRRPFYERGQFAESFDDEGAKKGWCLYKLGCKGPTTYNACAVLKWNEGTSFPIEAGHGCLGCSEPNFWDAGSFYNPLSTATHLDAGTVALAGAVGVGVGAAAGAAARSQQKKIKAAPAKAFTPTKAEEESQ
ncbi:hydrogenase small subunit [Celeribacter litoreus]|uniref:hydrogenase small subunit n=1 Tax=Celeribacter litoreus TaxID=2876714 RepID=UPI001CCFE17A|nr:hydrogenase small subunit [Celeribacter litoreus]MCA0044375.1 hydrogenase small subunit [Celeribacter litoreus]